MDDTFEPEERDASQWEMLRRLDKDLRTASRELRRDDVRFLVKMYYLTQEHRKQYANQVKSSADAGESHQLSQWFFKSIRDLENDIKRSMTEFSDTYRITQWLTSITGVGPVISAGLVSHFDIRLAPTCGHFWRIAGMDPTQRWLGTKKAEELVNRIVTSSKPGPEHLEQIAREISVHPTWFQGRLAKGTKKELAALVAKRPWNAELKSLCLFKAGGCFVKTKGCKDPFYGILYDRFKAEEVARNDRGDFAEQATRALSEKTYRDETVAKQWYLDGKLPPAHVDARARRKTVKIFISHLHEAMYFDLYGEPAPRPYQFTKADGDHRHYIAPPNWNVLLESKARPIEKMFN